MFYSSNIFSINGLICLALIGICQAAPYFQLNGLIYGSYFGPGSLSLFSNNYGESRLDRKSAHYKGHQQVNEALPEQLHISTISHSINVQQGNRNPKQHQQDHKRHFLSRSKREVESGSINKAATQPPIIPTISSFNNGSDRETYTSTLNEKRAAVMIIIVYVISGMVILFYRIILDNREN